MRVLLAEDEPLMRERLVAQLHKLWPEAQLVHIAETGNDAWDGYLEHEPEVVFLDIRMPGLSGLEVAQRIGAAAQVVFITAYDNYAIEAFEAGSVDYLLKPVEEARLLKTIQRLQSKSNFGHAELHQVLQKLQQQVQPEPAVRQKWLKASVGKQIKLINIDDVLFFQSDSKYTRVVLSEYEALIRTPIKELLSSIDTQQFWQIHRATIVNANFIAAAERIDAERMQVLLKGCAEKLAVSRNFTHLFRE